MQDEYVKKLTLLETDARALLLRAVEQYKRAEHAEARVSVLEHDNAYLTRCLNQTADRADRLERERNEARLAIATVLDASDRMNKRELQALLKKLCNTVAPEDKRRKVP